MPLPDDIAANLPPPRDDEPASLRRDILDELADHLRCALDREEQRQAAMPEARAESQFQRVLKRFGNPAQVALRLWSDAMWDKIMSQRILIAICGIVAVACCAAVFAAVRLVALQERALADQRAAWDAQQQTTLAQQRELAETLREIRDQSRTSTQSAEWVPVTVRLVGENGQPSVPPGFKVRLRMMNGGSVAPWEQTSDGREPVRFPTVRYGQSQLDVESPWGDLWLKVIEVLPGAPFEIDVACPTGPPETIVVMPELELPDDLKDRELYVQLALGRDIRTVGSERWETPLPIKGTESNWTILVGRDRTLHPSTTRADVEPHLNYDSAGDLVGIRWPHPGAVPRYLTICLAVPTGGGTKRVYALRSESDFEQEIEFHVDPNEHRAIIRFTERALESIRKDLKRFHATPPHRDAQESLIAEPWVSGKDDLLRPAISGKRPPAEAAP